MCGAISWHQLPLLAAPQPAPRPQCLGTASNDCVLAKTDSGNNARVLLRGRAAYYEIKNGKLGWRAQVGLQNKNHGTHTPCAPASATGCVTLCTKLQKRGSAARAQAKNSGEVRHARLACTSLRLRASWCTYSNLCAGLQSPWSYSGVTTRGGIGGRLRGHEAREGNAFRTAAISRSRDRPLGYETCS